MERAAGIDLEQRPRHISSSAQCFIVAWGDVSSGEGVQGGENLAAPQCGCHGGWRRGCLLQGMLDEAAPGFRQLRGLLGDVLWSREINTAKGN